MELFHYFLRGFLLTISLIVAVGAQNAYMLRIGLLRQNVLLAVNFCVFSDLLVMGLGAFVLAWVLRIFPMVEALIYVLGAIFLLIYGGLSFAAIRRDETLTASDEQAAALSGWRSLIPLVGVTYLNPHFYIDTFFLIGAQISLLAGWEQTLFYAGCSMASFVWFYALGYGVRILRPVFARPFSWKLLHAGIGVFMWVLAFWLIVEWLAL